MGTATTKAITLMLIALPTMFAVIAVFIVATKVLHSTFPAPPADDDDDDEDEDDEEDD